MLGEKNRTFPASVFFRSQGSFLAALFSMRGEFPIDMANSPRLVYLAVICVASITGFCYYCIIEVECQSFLAEMTEDIFTLHAVYNSWRKQVEDLEGSSSIIVDMCLPPLCCSLNIVYKLEMASHKSFAFLS